MTVDDPEQIQKAKNQKGRKEQHNRQKHHKARDFKWAYRGSIFDPQQDK
jgi:hypothetical protein